MKQLRSRTPRSQRSWAALDALVLAEIESLSGGTKRSETSSDPRPTKSHPTPPTKPSKPREAPVAALRADEPITGGETYDAALEADLLAPGRSNPPDDDGPTPSLLSAEEEAFVTRAVTFLSGREHADMMLGRVWEQLTELHPEGFFEPSLEGPPVDDNDAVNAPPQASPPSEEAHEP